MKSLALLLLGFIIFLRPLAQTVQSTPGRTQDSVLFNGYLHKAKSFSSSHKDSSTYYASKALQVARSARNPEIFAKYYHFFAAAYNRNGSYDSAMSASNRELQWALASGDTASIAWAYNAIANTYEYMGNMDSAASNFIAALNLVTRSKVKYARLHGTLNYNLASVLYLMGEYPKALDYAKKGLETGSNLADTQMMANSLSDIGSIYVGLEKYDSALSIFSRVIGLVKNTADSSTVMDALGNMGDVYARQGNFSKAIETYKKMLTIAQRDHNRYELLYGYGNLGITQYQADDLTAASENLHRAIALGRQMNAQNELRQFYESLSKVKEAQLDYPAALAFRKMYDSLNQKLMNESARKNIHSLEVKYATAQKDKEIAQQRLTLTETQHIIEEKNVWIGFFIAGSLALCFMLFLAFRNFRHRKKLQEQAVIALQQQHDMQTLKAKMQAREEERNRIGQEMHDDIGSALTTIMYLSEDLVNQPGTNSKTIVQRISATAGKVVDKMNEIIWSLNHDYDTIDDLIAYTRQHAAQFLGDHGIHYQFEAPDPVPAIALRGEQRRNIYLTIKEALHNIVKHSGATNVEIHFQLNGKLKVTIHDDGQGFDRADTRHFGNGLKNMKLRMQALGGTFELTGDNGTTVGLECPVVTENV